MLSGCIEQSFLNNTISSNAYVVLTSALNRPIYLAPYMGLRAALTLFLVFGLSAADLRAEPKSPPKSCASFLIALQSTIQGMIEKWEHPDLQGYEPMRPRPFKVAARLGRQFPFRERRSIGRWQKEILAQLEWKPNHWNIRQSTKNALAILVASWNAKRSVVSMRALVAFSFLHPLVDGPLDRGEIPELSLMGLRQKLLGMPVKAMSSFERDAFYLLDIIQQEFPRREHAQLWWLFVQLFDAQIEAMKVQRSFAPTEDEILKACFKKGGLCLALSSYVGKGSLNDSEFVALVREGGIFQLFDDLGDVKQDLGEGTRTLFTENFGAHNSADRLNRMIGLQLSLSHDTKNELPYFSEASYLGMWFYLGRLARFSRQEIEPVEEIISNFSPVSRWLYRASYFMHRRALKRNQSREQTEESESIGLPAEYFVLTPR